ncbi:lamin tail domain-containing protein [Akkermansiaceae bacterium]|nr:lamin tail domain-containing protein [Akkermansiaceae bacterium]
MNDEFRILFADRVHKHMFNGGALSESESVARYLKLADEIDKAIVAESARWGDTQDNTPYGNTASSSNNIDADYYPPTINDPIYFTREQHWVVERDVVTNHYIPILHDESDSRSIVRELRARNLYPSIDPPIYSQHGGIVPSGFDLAVTASEGNIYYTTDGSDPRLTGGGINPSAGMLTGGALADTFLDFEATGWRFLDNGVAQSNSNVVVGNGSYNATDWKHPDFNDNSWGTGQAMLGYGAVGSVPIRTTVGPAGTPRNITTYFRKEFTVSGAADYTELTFDLIRDDGAIVYLNGKEIDRSNLADGVITATSLATSASPEDEIVPLSTLTLAPGDLVEGVNVIAVEVHQTSTGSSDLGVDLRVRGIKPNPGASDVTLTETGTLKARSFGGGEWSALTEADFIVGIPASPSNLVVSEINYNPAGVDDTKEWLELMNISATAIDLTDVSFTGITYTFPAGTTLEAGQRIVLVKDQAGFAADYDTAGILIAPGVFAGSLNNGGEELAIIDATGTVDIQRFTYLDQAPWPTAPDGTGATLVLVSPQSSPAHGDPASWRSSFNSGGSPGGSDGQTFTGDPDVDLDGDGLTALLEYAFGSINGDAGPSPESVISVGQGLFGDPAVESLAITFRRNLAAEDVIITVEGSADLVDWDLVQTQIVSAIPNGDGTETVTYRSLSDIAVTTREFIRVKVTQSP